MPTSRQRNHEMYDRGARIYAMAANMLEGTDREEWRARGLSEGDVMFALALGSILLRINSIELGLKHILDREMGRPVPKKHDLVILWNRLTDEWKEKVAEARRPDGRYPGSPRAVQRRRRYPEVRRTFGRADHATSCDRYDEEACGGPPETGQYARRPGTPANRASASGPARTRRLTPYPALSQTNTPCSLGRIPTVQDALGRIFSSPPPPSAAGTAPSRCPR